ncbi:MAG: two pore domain potassium channel family protein [Spirulina sp. DLM2.Bin59]|nr:MAG: two pore domain potassium channel family protein [Spirulina sp. DLM2.Bin59]
MSDPPQTDGHDALVEAIAQAIAIQLDPKGQNLELVEIKSYPRFGGMIRARQWMTGLVALGLGYAIANSLLSLWPTAFFPLRFTLALGAIASGLTLVILLMVELLQGAGTDQEVQWRYGDRLLREYQFIPSLNQFIPVLLLLALGLLTIIFGFANLYGELVRYDPSHFSGLTPGLYALYFSLVTFSTVGYGDIHADSFLARLAAVGEIFTAMFFSLVVISTILSWVIAHKRQEQELTIKQRIRDRGAARHHPAPPGQS